MLSDADRKSFWGDALPIMPGNPGLSQSPASGVIWVVGVSDTVLWGDGETTWMDTSELTSCGESWRSMTAEPAEEEKYKGQPAEVTHVRFITVFSPLFTASLQKTDSWRQTCSRHAKDLE